MIAWSIEAAKNSHCFDAIIVSTDDEEIAEIARKWGADVPFLRPADLSGDLTPTIPVLHHAVQAYEKISARSVSQGCCIYATAPFVTASALRKGQQLLESDHDLDFAFSVTSFPFPIQRAIRINSTQRVEMLEPEHELTRSQDLPDTYHDAGQFYWFRPQALSTRKGFFRANSAPVILPRKNVQDIDTLEDWQCAELAHKLLEQSNTPESP